MKKSSGHNWNIEHECPQCGAPVILEETDRLFTCAYCRTKLYLLPRSYFKYYLPPSPSLSADFSFVPYWRFKGMSFFCGTHGVTCRVSDLSALASGHLFLPRTLGFRPQTLRLRFLSSRMAGKFFPAQVSFDTMMASVGRRAPGSRALSSLHSTTRTVHIGETVSLIYTPLFAQGRQFRDAILGKPVAPLPGDFHDDRVPYDQGDDQQISFATTLCPRCGWDLIAERDSVVLLCKNCESAWEASSGGLEPLGFRVLAAREPSALYLPFWRMKIHMQGFPLRSYADVVRMAHLPKKVKREWETEDPSFWVPAFKVSPEILLRLACSLSLYPFDETDERRVPKMIASPVTLPSREAQESLKVVLAELVADKKTILPHLEHAEMELKHHHLVFLPFSIRGTELVQNQTRCCLHPNLLRLGRHL